MQDWKSQRHQGNQIIGYRSLIEPKYQQNFLN